jgi:hypothetical protein
MRSATGIVNAVQEGRFQLATDDGRFFRFMLHHRASIEPQDLSALQRSRARVRVDFRDSKHMIAGIARRLSIEEP